jgi:hypothetical protein
VVARGEPRDAAFLVHQAYPPSAEYAPRRRPRGGQQADFSCRGRVSSPGVPLAPRAGRTCHLPVDPPHAPRCVGTPAAVIGRTPAVGLLSLPDRGTTGARWHSLSMVGTKEVRRLVGWTFNARLSGAG